MKVKLDENIFGRIVLIPENSRHDVDTVESEGLKGRPDGVVWRAAQQENRFLITQDLDFSDTRQFKLGTHAGLLLVRLREPGADALVSRISEVNLNEGLDSFARCFVVLTDLKLRIRRP